MQETPQALPSQPKHNPKHVRIFSDEDLAEMRRQAAMQGYEPPPGKTSIESPIARREQASTTKQEAKQEFMGKAMVTLQQEVNRLDVAIQDASRYLNNLQRNPLGHARLQGAEAMAVDPQRIVAVEDSILGYKIRRDALEDALRALESGSSLPPDLGKILSAMQQEAAEQLARTKADTEGSPLQETILKDDRKKLQDITELMNDLGL